MTDLTQREWQPIETAPKDQDVLLFDGEKQFVGRMTLKVGHQFAPVEKFENWHVWEYWPKPTYWMPLPSTPKPRSVR